MPEIIKLKNNLKKFVDNVTIGGFINASISKNIEVRIFWILIILTSFGLCHYIIYCNYENYLTFESKTTIREINEVKSKFPTVVICNRNTFTNEFSFKYLKNFSLNLNQSFKSQNDFLYKAYASYLNKIEHKNEIKLIDYEIDDVLLTCEFNQEECDGSYFKTFYHNIYRNCYMFNSDSSLDSFASDKERGLTIELFAGVYDQLEKYSISKGLAVIIVNNTISNATNMGGLFVSTGKFEICVGINFNNYY
jgi:hypothetical protein